jgi:hypothetical protein
MFKRKSKQEALPPIKHEWPQDGDVYFWVRSDIGMICHSEWANEGPYHQFRKDTGNCFRTRADAKNAISDCIAYNAWKTRPE